MAVIKWKGLGGWITLYTSSIKNRLRKDKNLGDLTNKLEAIKNLGLVGDISSESDPDSPTDKHSHDKRYKRLIADLRNEIMNLLNRLSIEIKGDGFASKTYQDRSGLFSLHLENVTAAKCQVKDATTGRYRFLVQDGVGAKELKILPHSLIDTEGNVQHEGTIYCGAVEATGDVVGARVYNAVWNDYAEFFPKKGLIMPGDLVALDLESDKEVYVKAGSSNAMSVVGVCSDEYAHLIGGDKPPEGIDYIEYNSTKYVPVALAGRVRVYVQGPAKKGDLLVPGTDGCAQVYVKNYHNPASIIGMLVEGDERSDKRRLRMKVKA